MRQGKDERGLRQGRDLQVLVGEGEVRGEVTGSETEVIALAEREMIGEGGGSRRGGVGDKGVVGEEEEGEVLLGRGGNLQEELREEEVLEPGEEVLEDRGGHRQEEADRGGGHLLLEAGVLLED